MQAMLDSPTDIAKKSFDQLKMRFPRGMHEKADLLDCISDIRACQSQVLKSSSNASVI